MSERFTAGYWYTAGFVSYVVASIAVWEKTRPRLEVTFDKIFVIQSRDLETAYVTVHVDAMNRLPSVNSFIDTSLTILRDSRAVEGLLCDGSYYLMPEGYA